MPGYLNRHRASLLMQQQGLSALVLAQPESITYATGAFPGVASNWRRAGAAFLLVPADQTAPLTAIVGDLQAETFKTQSTIEDVRSHRIWVETESYPARDKSKPKRTSRPAQFRIGEALALLRDAVQERGLVGETIGLELGFIPVADFAAFQALEVTWKDCTNIVERLRAIKQPQEIENLRRAASYAAAGMNALIQTISPGMDAERMAEVWEISALMEAEKHGHPPPQSTWAYIAVGGDGFRPGGPATPGDIIKIDVGCVVDGYSSDGGRTAVLGKPSPHANAVHDALLRAFEAGFELIQPGTPLHEIYRATATCMWDQGYDTYGRGHFGHGVGASIWSEEWPYISDDSTAILEPNMVLAFETPWYIKGLGGFIIEDQILVTEDSCEVMAPLDRALRVIG